MSAGRQSIRPVKGDVVVRLVPWQRVVIFFAGMKALDYGVDLLFDAIDHGGVRNWIDAVGLMPFCFLTGLVCWCIAIWGEVPRFGPKRDARVID